MSSFIQAAQKKVTDIRAYLRDQQVGDSIKYRAEKGATHVIYIPFENVEVLDENGNASTVRQIKCISGNVHEWTGSDGKYKSTVCLKDTIRKGENGEMLNDGSCPFCDRIEDAWEIYNMRKEQEEKNCTLTDPHKREEHMKAAARTFGDERKAKKANQYVYLLVAQFKTDKDKQPILENGLPAYDLRVMKLSYKRLEKIMTQVSNAGDELPGCELMFTYPSTDDQRLIVSQSAITLMFPQKRLTTVYPDVANKIAEDAAKFSFEGLDKQGFPEWEGMTSEKAKEVTDAQFYEWDKYKRELKVNPNAKYLEYTTATDASNPSLSGAPAVPTIAAPTVAAPNLAAPNADGTGAPEIPGLGAGNISDLFGAGGAITI